jgi:nucleoside-diphosphate-sugar epimerase
MDILVVGGHGQVALHLLKILAGQGHTARGLIRNTIGTTFELFTGDTPIAETLAAR